MRNNVDKQTWDIIRKDTYKKSNYKCGICGEKGNEHPVECHEIWEYNKKNKSQTLKQFISLCPSCHQVKHIGLANIKGKFDQALEHFMKINKVSDKSLAMEYIKYYFTEHSERSQIDWNFDISFLSDKFNIDFAKTKFKNKERKYISKTEIDNKLLFEKIDNAILTSDKLFVFDEDVGSLTPNKQYDLIYMRKLDSKSGSDFKLDHILYEFLDENGEIINIRESKTMNFDVFIKGCKYQIKTDGKRQTIYVAGNKKGNKFEIFRKGGNIITHNCVTGKYHNQSRNIEVDENFKPLNGVKLSNGIANYNKAAQNKLMKGTLTKDLLLKMNLRGVFFVIKYYDPQDKRKFGNFTYYYSETENKVIINKETQEEINNDLEDAKSKYLNQEILPFFNIETKILTKKKRRK